MATSSLLCDPSAAAMLRSSRTITRTGVSLARGGGTVRVDPGVAGTARVTVQGLDPEFGWQYLRTIHVRLGGGRAGFAQVLVT